MKKNKVALIHNIISPYRIPLFVKLFNDPSIDFYVYYCNIIDKDRPWGEVDNANYKFELLNGLSINIKGFIYNIKPIIIYKLIKNNYDTIIIGGYTDFPTQMAFIVSKLFNKHIILWSEGIESSQSQLSKILDPLNKFIVRNVDAIIVPGTLSKNFYSKLTNNSVPIFVSPNIVDNDSYINNSLYYKTNKLSNKKILGINKDLVLLYTGRLIESKGVDHLILAYKKIKSENRNVCLVIVGDGVEKEHLQDLCRTEGISDVFFAGWINGDKKIMYYSIADLFVFPTLNDVWGLVINEAMCCGLPIITTYSAGCSIDMVEPGKNGFIINKSNGEELYLSIRSILNDDNLRNCMGTRSLTIIKEKFNLAQMSKGFKEAIMYCNSILK